MNANTLLAELQKDPPAHSSWVKEAKLVLAGGKGLPLMALLLREYGERLGNQAKVRLIQIPAGAQAFLGEAIDAAVRLQDWEVAATYFLEVADGKRPLETP